MKKICLMLIGVFLIFWLQPAHAYIDPGSGSAIMSAIIGFFVAVGLIVKTYWYKLKSLFLRNGSVEKDRSSNDAIDQKTGD